MHWESYFDSVLAKEMKKKKKNSDSFFNYDANLMLVITMKLKFFLRCWFLCMTSLAVTSLMLRTSLKF